MVRREMAILSVDSLPLGFRFRPTDVELVNHYLKGKISGRIKHEIEVIPVIDMCTCEPWDLPDKSLIKSSDLEWFFFAPKDRRYPTGNRAKRATNAGYWKATGKDRMIKSKVSGSPIIGTKKTLVFYRGRAPNGVRTTWIMHEYRTNDPELESRKQGGFVLCRLFKKPDDRTQNSDIDDLERTTDDIDNGGLSSAPIILPPGVMQHRVEASGEPVTPLDQKPPALTFGENLKPFPLTSDVQSSDVSELLADQQEITGVQTSNQEESNCNVTVISDAADHETDVTTEVDFSLDDFMQFDELLSDDFYFNSPVPPDVVNGIYGGVEQTNIPELNHHEPASDDSITEFLDSVLCDPDECSSEILNTGRGVNVHLPEEPNYANPDYSLLPLHSSVYVLPDQKSQDVSSFGADSGIIHRRYRKKEDSANSMNQQGVIGKLQLQRFVHKGSSARTDHVLSTVNVEVREITEHHFHEEKTASRLIHADAFSTAVVSSSKACGQPDTFGSRNRQKQKGEDSIRDRPLDSAVGSVSSYSTMRTVLIMSALLFFILVGLKWCLSS